MTTRSYIVLVDFHYYEEWHVEAESEEEAKAQAKMGEGSLYREESYPDDMTPRIKSEIPGD